MSGSSKQAAPASIGLTPWTCVKREPDAEAGIAAAGSGTDSAAVLTNDDPVAGVGAEARGLWRSLWGTGRIHQVEAIDEPAVVLPLEIKE